MNSYIIKEIAIEKIKCKKPKVLYSEYGVGYERGLEDAIAILNATPAEDVQMVKHGRWISRISTGDSMKCSICGNSSIQPDRSCGHCGARMDLKDGEQNG